MSYKGLHKIAGFFNYTVPPLEGFWWQDKSGNEMDYNEETRYAFYIRHSIARLCSQRRLRLGCWNSREEEKRDFQRLKFLTYDEGLCVQCMHIGTYDSEPETVAAMHEFAIQNGYQIDMSSERLHHEIYLSDPRKATPEKMKTVVRHPIK